MSCVTAVALAVLRPAEALDLCPLSRRFVLHSSEGLAETFGPQLLALIAAQAPGVTLQLLTKSDKDRAPLREGEIDPETGMIDDATAPELRAVPLFRDRWIGVVRAGHALAQGPILAARLAGTGHVLVLRRGLHSDGDEAARAGGPQRRIATVVGGFSTALTQARDTDLIATVPERHTEGLHWGMLSFRLPYATRPSPSRCCGVPAWTVTRRIAVCAAAFVATVWPDRTPELPLVSLVGAGSHSSGRSSRASSRSIQMTPRDWAASASREAATAIRS